METLVVLSALVCVITAAPTLPEENFHDTTSTTWSPLIKLIREKKSPQTSKDFEKLSDIGTSTTHDQDLDSTLPMARRSTTHDQDLDSTVPMARSLTFKKPIIVKKKVGYHLYRDSDEEKEHSTSRENCNEKVKVKFCDEKLVPNSMRMKTSTIEDINNHSMSEEEMKRSLIMAKEAISNLERDLKKMDMKQDMKLAVTKNEGASIDEIVHKDIDTARRALEHIDENFGNLESMSFHSTTLKDADELHDIHVTVAKSEEERVAQWKEAMENIQKNVDIVRNIEDSFRNFAHSMSLEEFGKSENNNSDAIQENSMNKLRNKDEQQSTTDHDMDEDMQCSSQIIQIKPKEKDANENDNMEDDLNPSATTVNESETKFTDRNFMTSGHFDNRHNEQLSQLSKRPLPDNMNNRNTELDISKTDQSDPTFMQGESMNGKAVEDKVIKKDPTSNNNLETDMDTAGSNNELTSTDTRLAQANSDFHKIQGKNELSSAIITHNFNNGDPKFNDKTENRFVIKQSNDIDGAKESTKPDEQLQRDELLRESVIHNKKMDNTNSKTKFLTNSESNHFHGKNQHIDNLMNKGRETSEDNQQSFITAFKPKETETNSVATFPTISNTKPQETSKHVAMRWSPEEMSNFEKTTLVKQAENFNNQNDFRADSHFDNPSQLIGTMKASNNFNRMGPHMHVVNVDKEHDHSSLSTSFVDGSVRPMNHHHSHWKMSQENARAAYGPAMGPLSRSISSGSNTVGLFPNANVGSYSIPLLLSCVPSVTSGSLAKALPTGYGPSPYRTEDDFTSFPNKREIKKPTQIPSMTANQISTTKQTTTVITDHMQ